MELIAIAVAFYAVFLPVFFALEVAAPHPGPARFPRPRSPEAAAERWLAAHPLKAVPATAAANDEHESLAA
jgi:hypothetical protein